MFWVYSVPGEFGVLGSPLIPVSVPDPGYTAPTPRPDLPNCLILPPESDSGYKWHPHQPMLWLPEAPSLFESAALLAQISAWALSRILKAVAAGLELLCNACCVCLVGAGCPAPSRRSSIPANVAPLQCTTNGP